MEKMSYDSTYDSTWSSPNSSNETSNSLEAVDSSPWPKVLIPAQAMPSSFSLGHSKTILSDSDTSSRSSSQRETAAELFGFKPNYYPHFDPKEYFCDTVAVENASMVAQIVGKKGAKIKHLVAKFGTRIRTPNVDQEPVFVIKGKRADVYKVKQEIMSAAAHFMRIELTKREKLDSVMNSEESTSIKLFVPTRYVGLVIGRNGRIVRELQTAHQVFIETPKFDLRHYFCIYGTELAIHSAIKAIYELLVKRSGICFSQSQNQVGNEVHFVE
ncbi:PREDICTED: RNA-binding E3 ubiquitin-protein ligase MEX3C-like [Rhagoletis zephyria]|uniref:RNA-binding E3 ubiquitin-protein ligase MEX3C-like n=1 Tax=Rhagoletis zephyria TaxID=28612 RepID=UPI000811718F|nr:PREDICTED: RNA-binding E3 ubiquitin-protein ligase MEX3C-like [Rhagoletis zephyria]KAH9393283.1 KH_3 protein [Tyrophagus putrescentiae]